ncbi:MAG: arylsulfatase [Alphaproteobacteria bacterium]|nr:arylsulfatase [Alphaproteobacteria bacterium]
MRSAGLRTLVNDRIGDRSGYGARFARRIEQILPAIARTLALAFGALCCLAAGAHAETPQTTSRPNIVVILFDDVALMDLGAYGGEAKTPNIDRLARQGALFRNHHTSPLCSPSRAMLLTGLDSHETGVSTIEEVLPAAQKNRKGYSLRLEEGVLTIADHLKAAGYRTLMAGKWHLGHGEGDLPSSHGFDRSLALDASGADNWAAKPYMPYYEDAPWFEDGRPVQLPDSFYSSELLVDRLIGYMNETPAGSAPLFAYLSLQAVHIPVQAPASFTGSYAGRFDAGWEALREARWKRAQETGLIPQNAPLAPMPEGLRAWSDLSADERAIYARSMEVYSGMLEAADHHIGRLIEAIEARGDLDNTLFVITSDNGPEPSDPVHAPGMNLWMKLHTYHWRLEGLGGPGSLAFIGPEWAASLSSPGSMFKFLASQGGLHVPLILSGPGVGPDLRIAERSFVSDVTPTLLDLAGVAPLRPEGSIPIRGLSLKGLVTPPDAEGGAPGAIPERGLGVEVSGNSAFFRGDYKIVRNMPTWGDGRWRLYNLTLDPGETRDLAAAEPDVFASMLKGYETYAAEVGVLELPDNYSSQIQILINSLTRQAGFYWPYLVALLGLIILLPAGAIALWLRGRRRQSGS